MFGFDGFDIGDGTRRVSEILIRLGDQTAQERTLAR